MFFNFCTASSFGFVYRHYHIKLAYVQCLHMCAKLFINTIACFILVMVMNQKNIIQSVYLRTEASQIFDAIVHGQGNRLFKEGKFELAKAKYEKVLFSSPYIASTFVWLTILFHAKAKDYRLVCFDIKIFWKMNHFPKSIFQKTISFSYV